MFPAYDLQWALTRRAEQQHQAQLERQAAQARRDHWLREQPRRSTPWLLRLANSLRGV